MCVWCFGQETVFVAVAGVVGSEVYFRGSLCGVCVVSVWCLCNVCLGCSCTHLSLSTVYSVYLSVVAALLIDNPLCCSSYCDLYVLTTLRLRHLRRR